MALLLALSACTDEPTAPRVVDPKTPTAPRPVGVYEFTMTGIGGPAPSGKASAVRLTPSGASYALNPVSSGISIEQISASSFVEGARGEGGQRYISFMYRVHNGTGAPLANLTLIPVVTAITSPGTPFSVVRLFDNTDAAATVAPSIVPTGAVALGPDGKMRSLFPDALQVFTEAEVAAIPLPSGVTGIFPYGFVVRNPSTATSRTLPVASGPNDFGGIVTLTFRLPLQPAGNAQDVFTIVVQMLAVEDTETRMTESIEESQDTTAVRLLRERAAALGATTVTVLPGSPVQSPFVADYPGQRPICTVRTAGGSGSPVTSITAPAAYTRLAIYRPGETPDPCGAYFRTGDAAPAHYGMPYSVTVRSMDRYGNVNALTADTVALSSSDGTATIPAAVALTGGAGTMVPSYTTYGSSTLFARGRRLAGESGILVTGMTRTWTGNVNTLWAENGDWLENMTTGVQDSVLIPGGRPNYPFLVQNQTIAGVTMTDDAITPHINLSAFDLTVNGSVQLGNTGQILGTGRLILNGVASTIGGGLSNFDVRNLRINGTYSVTSNVNVTGGRIVVTGGRLRSAGHRIRVRPN
ncbi:MAG: hypothetical protein ICV87_01585 [Gemmatimonadetes bacterium]|nr:hypothetical protein [Gemmatimonadota bacterium]